MGSSSLNLESLLAGSLISAISSHLHLPRLGPGPALSPLVCSLSLLSELPEWSLSGLLVLGSPVLPARPLSWSLLSQALTLDLIQQTVN